MVDRVSLLLSPISHVQDPMSNRKRRKINFPSAIQIVLTAGLLAVTNTATPAEDPNAILGLPAVTVTAQKEPAGAQTIPVSVTPVTENTLQDADVRSVKDAAVYAPNVFMNEFSVRALSNPFFRGVHGSPSNPGITTFVDGVPQLNGYSSSTELIDVEQLEFVRGPQGALFGRNTVGGLISLTSRRPALDAWSAGFEGQYGNYNFRDVRMTLSGPIARDQVGFSLAAGYSARDGYTINDLTGNRLDSREVFFGKVQLLWAFSEKWDVRLILSGERARDGDYALGDLDYLSAHPHHVSRDFEGASHRDIIAPTLLVNGKGPAIDFSFISGLVQWKTRDMTDLEYTVYPGGMREDNQKDLQVTAELRLASAKDTPVGQGSDLRLKWQAGISMFTQNYEQDAVNNFLAGGLYQADQIMPGFPPFNSAANGKHSPESRLDDTGFGAYAQTTLTAWEQLDLILGLRGDYESKKAELNTFYEAPDPILPMFGISTAPASLSFEESFSDVTPQFGLAYHFTRHMMLYMNAGRGYRAGGFNTLSPAGREKYDPETSWSYEIGAKTAWLDNRLSANLAFFYIDWQHLQLNLPMNTVDMQYYIANAAAAYSKGVELEINARPVANWDIFGGFSYTDAKFCSGAEAMWNNAAARVGGKRLIFTPEYTANGGMQYSWAIIPEATLYARAEVVAYGSYYYNPVNTVSQSAYSLADFRAGVKGRNWNTEVWVRNAFDRSYIPIALEYGPGRLVGENGPPRTFGFRTWLRF